MMGVAAGGGGGRRGTPLELTLAPDEVLRSGVLDDPAVQARLLPLLPEEQRNPDELRSLVRSPQFQQALGSLSSALHTPDNFNSVFANFGLDPADGAQALAGDAEAKDEGGDAKMDDGPPGDA